MNPKEKSDSEIFTFDKGGSSGGVIKLDDSFMKATLSVTTGGDNLNVATICDIMPHPLHTMWKLIDVSANEVSVTNSHTENLFVADILSCLYQHKDKNDDLAGCSIG